MKKSATYFQDFLDLPRPIAFAHRGGDERYPENTLAAFRDAYKLGYRYFETDVHYTVGHELVAFHDDNLKRTIGLKGSITKLTKKDRLGTRINGKYPIPLLSELLSAFPDVYFSIDAKSSGAVKPLVATIRALHAESRVFLASFSAASLKQIRVLLPDVPTTASQQEIARLRYSLRPRRSPRGVHYLSIPLHVFYNQQRIKLVTPNTIAKFHAKGCKVFVWTINETAEMIRLLDIGVDGIFTDKLSLLKDVLRSRGQW